MKKFFWLRPKLADGTRVGVVDRIVMSRSGGVDKLTTLLFNWPFDNPKPTYTNREGIQMIRREYNGVVVASNRLFTVVEIENE